MTPGQPEGRGTESVKRGMLNSGIFKKITAGALSYANIKFCKRWLHKLYRPKEASFSDSSCAIHGRQRIKNGTSIIIRAMEWACHLLIIASLPGP